MGGSPKVRTRAEPRKSWGNRNLVRIVPEGCANGKLHQGVELRAVQGDAEYCVDSADEDLTALRISLHQALSQLKEVD